jgi:C4-dicarboxylate-specific signal transduction histidine kinase
MRRERRHVSLNHLLRDAVELLACELRIANVEVSFDLQKDLPLVWPTHTSSSRWW